MLAQAVPTGLIELEATSAPAPVLAVPEEKARTGVRGSQPPPPDGTPLHATAPLSASASY